MEKEEYQRIHQNEAHHWWYRALHQFGLQCLGNVLSRFRATRIREIRLLDAGCGTGYFLTQVHAQYPECSLYGIDLSPEALNFATKNSSNTIKLSRGSVCCLPFADNAFDIITSFDVIYIAEVPDDLQALREFYRVLTPNGVLLLQVPAFEFLRGQHDEVVHTKKRYRRRQLTSSLSQVGFRVTRATYRVNFLFPLIAFTRILQRIITSGPSPAQSDLARPSPLVNRILSTLMGFENWILTYLTLPFGVSLFVVAAKFEAKENT